MAGSSIEFSDNTILEFMGKISETSETSEDMTLTRAIQGTSA